MDPKPEARDIAPRLKLNKPGILPLEFLLAVVRNDDLPLSSRVDAAKSASPYVHKKMPTVIEGGDKPLFDLSPEDLRALSKDELAALKHLLYKMGVEASENRPAFSH